MWPKYHPVMHSPQLKWHLPNARSTQRASPYYLGPAGDFDKVIRWLGPGLYYYIKDERPLEHLSYSSPLLRTVLRVALPYWMMLAGSVPPRFLWGAETSWDLGELLPLPNQRADIRLPMASAYLVEPKDLDLWIRNTHRSSGRRRSWHIWRAWT